MSSFHIFEQLPVEEIKRITDKIDKGYELISIILVTGDVLIGCLAKHWEWNGVRIDIGFNTNAGKRYGHSHVLYIPLTLVASIQKIALSEASTPQISGNDPSLAFFQQLGLDVEKFRRLPVQDYPNPLATILSKHNLKIAKENNLAGSFYMEMSLPADAIPPEGIELEEDLILYADWEFFSRQMQGGIDGNRSIFFSGISGELTPSLQALAMSKLISLPQSIIPNKSIIGLPLELLITGKALVPDLPITTNIEGEECIVITCKTEDRDYPVLLKPRVLKYPLEFINYISSQLVFYGEAMPIPLMVSGIMYSSTLLVRSIGYIHKSSNVFPLNNSVSTKNSILFLGATPISLAHLRLNTEFREIQEKLQLAKQRDKFHLEQRMAVRPTDISQALLDVQPRIVHFSSHGTPSGELWIENEVGEAHPIEPEALEMLFKQFSSQVQCVVLSACYSTSQAEAISKHIDYVIGMNQEIGDKAAIAFAIGFYQALGAGRTFEDAFDLGRAQIKLQNVPEHLSPQLIKKSSN